MIQIVFIIFVTFVLTLPPTAYAETTTSLESTTVEEKTLNRQTAKEEAKTARQAERTETQKTRATKEIDRRITSLTNLVTKIGELQKLPVAQKTSYTTKIQTEIANLTALKAKIAADTDAITLKTDVQSIVTSFRVYALFMPQMHLLLAADRLSQTADHFSSASAKLQAKLTQAQTAGKDVTSLQTTFTSMQAKLADAKTQAQNVTSSVSALTPEGFPGNKTVMMQAHTMIKTGREDLRGARKDAETIIKGLKETRAIEKQTTPSAATTGATTPATLR